MNQVVARSVEEVITQLRQRLHPRRAMIVGIDGPHREDRSTLARRLAAELGISVVELDLFLPVDALWPDLCLGDLWRVLHSCLDRDWPVIVEGVCLLRVLRELPLPCDVLVYVRRNRDMLSKAGNEVLSLRVITGYQREFQPEAHADLIYTWSEPCVAG